MKRSIDPSQCKEVYRGSVKTVLQVLAPGRVRTGLYLFTFTDDYSVFDYGKMPDRIRGKGSALTVMSAYFFEQLEDPGRWQQLSRSSVWERLGGKDARNLLTKTSLGKDLLSKGLRTHYRGLIDCNGRTATTTELEAPTNLLLVEAAPVILPEQTTVAGQAVWNYNEFNKGAGPYLIPLENVFRFGIPKGSSLLERVQQDPAYARQLGVPADLKEDSWLPFPLLEFFTKLEPTDRHLSLEMAVNCSGLLNSEFSELIQRTLLVAVFLFDLFDEKGLTLWDGKLEFIKTGKGIILADAITPDEVRLTFDGVQFSKEILRQYYKNHDTAFMQAIRKAKQAARGSHGSLRAAVQRGQGVRPRKLEHGFLQTVEVMYRSLAKRITGLDIFGDTVELDRLPQHLARWNVTT